MPTTKTETIESLLTKVETAVQNWGKAKAQEYSAIWSVIHACYEARMIGGANKEQVRAKLNRSTEKKENFPTYNKDSIKTLTSNVLTIAFGATDKHFKKWKEDGTGYWKAYNQIKDANKPKGYNNTVKKTDTKIGEGGEVQETISTGKIEPSAQGSKPSAGLSKRQIKPSPGKQQLAQTEAEDPSWIWVTRISQDDKLWGQFLINLGKEKLITYNMLFNAVNAYLMQEKSSQERRADEFISTTLSRNELLYICAQRFVQDNPEYPGQPKSPKLAVVAKQKKRRKNNSRK